jgi:hypothetical protein
MNENIIMEIVEELKEAASGLKKLDKLNDIQYGELLGYAEALSIIKNCCYGYNLARLGLDFDIDKTYL